MTDAKIKSGNRAKALFLDRPLVERGRPIYHELLWVLAGRPNEATHQKLLPDYCYHILAVQQKTLFKAYPKPEDSLLVTDAGKLQSAQTVAEAKQGVRLDFENFGKLLSIGARCLQFFDQEAGNRLQAELADYTPEKNLELFTVIFGRAWVTENRARILAEPVETILLAEFQKLLQPKAEQLAVSKTYFENLAYEWSPAATGDYLRGSSEGYDRFLDTDGQLAGENTRSNLYLFLLLVWPEIQSMLTSVPRQTVTDLHAWLLPFMHEGVLPMLDLDYLRDVCEPPPRGIGIRLGSFKKSSAE